MKLIFLDLDGVLGGYTQHRFENDLNALKQSMIDQYGKKFEVVDIYDLGAAYYDWNKKALELFKQLVFKTKAKIVLSSDRRIAREFEQLHPIFEYFGLGEALIDFTPRLDGKMHNDKHLNRSDEIKMYLDNTDLVVDKFVIIDDCNFSYNINFPNEFVRCKAGYFNEEHLKQSLKILNKRKLRNNLHN